MDKRSTLYICLLQHDFQGFLNMKQIEKASCGTFLWKKAVEKHAKYYFVQKVDFNGFNAPGWLE